MDRKKFKVRYLMGLVVHPITLIPFLGGMTLFGLLAVLGKGAAWLFGVSGVMLSLGLLFTRAILCSDKIAEQALKEVEQEANRHCEDALDDLDARLSEDDDPRDETLLRNLRELFLTIKADGSWRSRFDSTTVSKLRAALDESFDQSVEKLKKALEYKEQAEEADNKKVRKLLLEDREKLLKEVKLYVDEFESVFGELRDIRNASTDPQYSMTRLKQTLEIGKRVRDSMASRGMSLDE